MLDGNDRFIRYDLAITRDVHMSNLVKGLYPSLDLEVDPNLHIKEESVPDFSDLAKLLLKVGKPYGWHLRKEYHSDESVARISERLRSVPPASRYSFWCNQREVGGAIIANVEPNIGSIFQRSLNENNVPFIDPSLASRTVEIYKIGISPDYTKRGWGKFFLPQLLTSLFQKSADTEVVYLNTRDTNHTGVIKFYRGFNMNVINATDRQNDLIDESEISPKSPLYTGPIRQIA